MRVVRFTDVDAERVTRIVAQIEEAGGPPPGVDSSRIQLLFDEEQGNAVVLQYFDSADAMQRGGEILGAMDPPETPGTRVSVDTCEVKLDL